MAVEDKFDGARNAFTFYYAFFNMVADKIGLQQAIALSEKVDKMMGAAQGKLTMTEIGENHYDLKEATLLARRSIEEGFGISSEMVDLNKEKAVFRIKRGPVYEAAHEAGLDDKTIETLCQNGPLKFMDAMVKEMNPQLNYNLEKFRPGMGDYCEESIARS